MFLIERIKRDPKTVALAQQIIDTYNPQSPKDMGEALTAIFGSLFESMLQGKMNNHLGYSSFSSYILSLVDLINLKTFFYFSSTFCLCNNFSKRFK